jgi:hypothetical protein
MTYSIISVELTLVWNHLPSVLPGATQSGTPMIIKPAQLLPLLVGLFQVVRILYLAASRLNRLSAIKGPKKEEVGLKRPNSGGEMQGQRAYRYLIAWLPWLSQLPPWKKRLAHALQKEELSSIDSRKSNREV